MLMAVPHFANPTEFALGGAAAIGAVIGWVVSRTLVRTRASLKTLGAVVGAILGGTVTKVFGDADGSLFGLYGIGLLVGFALYLVVYAITNPGQLGKVLGRSGGPNSGD
jgi:hypothetical protein